MFESDKTPLINTSNTIIKESSDMPAYNNDTKNDIADYDVTVTATEKRRQEQFNDPGHPKRRSGACN